MNPPPPIMANIFERDNGLESQRFLNLIKESRKLKLKAFCIMGFEGRNDTLSMTFKSETIPLSMTFFRGEDVRSLRVLDPNFNTQIGTIMGDYFESVSQEISSRVNAY